MRKILFGLTTLLCIITVSAGMAFASKTSRTHKVRTARPDAPRTYSTTDSVSADTLLHFAQTLIGTRYRTATSDPNVGFDCSGFVSYVFKTFNFDVPRSSCEFINVGEKIRLEDCKPGDVILFTGTSKRSRRIGHVGIIFSNNDGDIKFIHSTSGKEHGVTITNMDATYHRRYVQIVRLLKTNADDALAEQNFLAAAHSQGY